jgi:hypothetical protein
MLNAFGEQHRSTRLAVGIAGIVAGTAGMLTGVLLIERSERLDRHYGLAIGAGGLGMILGSAIGLALQDPFRSLREALETSASRGLTPAQRLAFAEREWARIAQRSRWTRRTAASIMIALGAVGMGSGIGMLLLRDSSPSTAWYATGTAALSLGAFAAVAGAGILVAPDPLEQTWEVYRRTRGLGVGFGALPNGVWGAVEGVF